MESIRKRAILAVAGAATMGLAAIVPAFACTGVSSMTVTPTEVAPGSEVRVEASGFSTAPGNALRPIELWWVGEGGTGKQLLASPTPNPEGILRVEGLKIPADAKPGSYLLRIKDSATSAPPAATASSGDQEEFRAANGLVKVTDVPAVSGAVAGARGETARPLTATAADDFDARGSAASPALVAALGLMGLALVGGTASLVLRPRARLARTGGR